jgi:hypothetical protein
MNYFPMEFVIASSEDFLRSAEVKRVPTERRIEHRRTNARRRIGVTE